MNETRTMVASFRNSLVHSATTRTFIAGRAARGAAFGAVWLLAVAVGFGKAPYADYHCGGELPPGAMGHGQLACDGALAGYFQPVQIRAPSGAWLSAASAGTFDADQRAPLTVGLLIGQAYRFRVTGIPRNEGLEVFPTIEVIDRLYPPPGHKARFPIPIELTLEELEMALAGKMVTRVIYVEDPRTALPLPEDPRRQRYFEVLPGEDPVLVARQVGRPVALLRMGSRLPGDEGPDDVFLFGSPPMERYAMPAADQPPTTPQANGTLATVPHQDGHSLAPGIGAAAGSPRGVRFLPFRSPRPVAAQQVLARPSTRRLTGLLNPAR